MDKTDEIINKCVDESFDLGRDYILYQLNNLVDKVSINGGDSVNVLAGIMKILAKEGYYERNSKLTSSK